MVKVIRSVYVDKEILDLLKAKGLSISKVVNETLSALLLSNNPQNWEILMKAKEEELLTKVKEREGAILQQSAELATMRAKLKELKVEKKKKAKEEDGRIIFRGELR